MRLLITTDTIGGVWTFTKELTEALLPAGAEVSLISFGRLPSTDQQSWADCTSSLWPHSFRFEPTLYPLEWMQANSIAYEEPAALLLRVIDEFQPDILHLNQFCFGALPVSIPKIVTAHSDVLSWWTECRGPLPQQDPWLEIYKALVRRGLEQADVITAPTQWMLDQIALHFGSPRHARVIPNGRSLAAPLAVNRKLQAVTAGRLWDEGKNVTLLNDVHSPIPILLAGDSFMTPGPPSIPLALNCLGPLSEAATLQLFSESSVYIATSRYEPFGLAPLEAALCGCAILAHDIPSLREVWGDAALYFETADDLTHLLHLLSADRHALEDIAARSCSRAHQLYTREHFFNAYWNLYSGLAVEARNVA